MKSVSDVAVPPRAWSRRGGWMAVVAGSLVAFLVGLPIGAALLGSDQASPDELVIGGQPTPKDPLEARRHAAARYEISSTPMRLLGGEPLSQKAFDAKRRTQAAYVKSTLVITAALAQPGLAGSELLKNQEDPVTWLLENLVAYYPGDGEIFTIALPHPTADKADLLAIVNAVAKAYQGEIVFRDRAESALPLQLLKKAQRDLGERLAKLHRIVSQEADDADSRTPDSAARQRELSALGRLDEELIDRIYRMQIELQAPSQIRPIGAHGDGNAIAELIDPEEKLPWLPR